MSLKEASVDQVELQKRKEALTLEAAEHNLDLERLETRELLVARAEDDVSACEARAQEEVDRRVAEARTAFECEYETRLGLIKVEAEGGTAALRAKLTEATRRADSSAAAFSAAQAELSSSRAEQLLLQQRVNDTEAVAQQSEDELRRRRFWSMCMPPCFRRTERGPTQIWAMSARLPRGSRTRSTTPATTNFSLMW